MRKAQASHLYYKDERLPCFWAELGSFGRDAGIKNEKTYHGRDPLHFRDSRVPAEVSQVAEVVIN
jgi:hypothetical protein